MKRRGLLPFTIAVGCATAAVALHGVYVRHSPVAAAQPAPHAVRVVRSNATCGLSAIDQIKAVDAFSKMVPVFRHPRCFNCHGNFDIASTDVHSGATAVPKGVDFREVLTVSQRQQLHVGCGECHNQIEGQANRPTKAGDVIVSGWMMAPAPMQWVQARDNEQLCILVKSFEDHPDMFIDHVASDHGEIQFVDAAFKGNRGLDSTSMDTYDVVTERPPGTIEGLIEDAMRWARLVGAHWKDSPDCGCVKPKVELIMRGEIIGKADGQSISGEFNSKVLLEPDTLSVYTGSGTVALSNFKMPIPANCTVTHNVPPSRIAVKELRFGTGDSNEITLLLHPDNSTGTHTMSCPLLPRPVTLPVITPMQQWRFVHGADLKGTDYLIKDFEIKAQSGNGRSMVARKEVTRTIPAQGGSVSAKTIFEIWTVPPTQ